MPSYEKKSRWRPLTSCIFPVTSNVIMGRVGDRARAMVKTSARGWHQAKKVKMAATDVMRISCDVVSVSLAGIPICRKWHDAKMADCSGFFAYFLWREPYVRHIRVFAGISTSLTSWPLPLSSLQILLITTFRHHRKYAWRHLLTLVFTIDVVLSPNTPHYYYRA